MNLCWFSGMLVIVYLVSVSFFWFLVIVVYTHGSISCIGLYFTCNFECFLFENNLWSRTTRKCKFKCIWLKLKKGKLLPVLGRSCSMSWHKVLPRNTQHSPFVLCIKLIWSCVMIRFFETSGRHNVNKNR